MRQNIIYIILVAMLIAGCSEQYDGELGLYPSITPRYLAVSTAELSFSSASSENTVDVASIHTPWKLENNVDWVTLSPQSGNEAAVVSVGVTENERGDEIRTGIFYLKSNLDDWQFEKPVSITQAGAKPSISLSKELIKFNGAENRETVVVTANCMYNVLSENDWITVNHTDNNIEICVTANETNDYRTGYVDVWFNGSVYLSKEITIQQAPATINASTESLVFGNHASEVEITIKAESSWTATTSNSWIEIAPTSGNAGESKMKVSVAPNTSVNERNGHVLLYIGGKQCIQIPIRQRGIYVEVENSTILFQSVGGTESLSVLSNTSWSISSYPDWITVDKSSGEGNETVKVTAAENPNTSSRHGEIHITQQGVSIDCVVGITQRGKTFEVNSTLLNFEDKKSSQSVLVESDGTWRASTDDSWITVSPAIATGNATLMVSVDENTGNSERIGVVYVTLGDKTSTINVVQQGKYFTVDNAMLTYGSKGGNINISVSTNDNWTARVEDLPSWLKLSATSGSGSMDIVATAADNPSVNKRTATIVLETVNHQSIRILVTQNARYLNVDAKEVLFYFKGGDSEPITISTDGAYKVTTSDTWFTTKVTGNNMVVTATENKTNEPRLGTITIELTDLREGTYSLTLNVTQLNYGGSFLRKGFNEDVNYDSEGITNGNLTITGYGNDTSWDTHSSSSITLSVSGYKSDNNWDTTTSSSVTVTVTGFNSDKNHDTSNTSSGQISKTEFGNDINWQ